MSVPKVEVHQATHEECLDISASYLRKAIADIEAGDTEHGLVWIDDDLLWMGRR